MSYYTTIHKETREGFDIVFSVCPEDSAPDWDFQSEEEERETLERINNGSLAWFIAKVEAYKMGVRLGVDYLGGCCYESEMDFVKEYGYYGDMVASVIGQSKAMIKALAEDATQ